MSHKTEDAILFFVDKLAELAKTQKLQKIIFSNNYNASIWFEELKESTEGIRDQVCAIIESNLAYYVSVL
jgi:hypothetical protein